MLLSGTTVAAEICAELKREIDEMRNSYAPVSFSKGDLEVLSPPPLKEIQSLPGSTVDDQNPLTPFTKGGEIQNSPLPPSEWGTLLSPTTHSLQPRLGIILIGDHKPAHRYVELKRQRCAEIGIESQVFSYPAEVSEQEILEKITQINNDSSIHGLIIQLPLPPHIDRNTIIERIDPKKDVDGFHPLNMGRTVLNQPCLMSATPLGVMRLLEYYHIDVSAKHAVVLGRSNIVGKPMAFMLINAGATVTSCNSKTPNIPEICKTADILISATGTPKNITRDFVKPGAVVIDIGQTYTDGSLQGDVDFDDVADIASAITPTPGGVGPMTIAMLLSNTVQAWKEQTHP